MFKEFILISALDKALFGRDVFCTYRCVPWLLAEYLWDCSSNPSGRVFMDRPYTHVWKDSRSMKRAAEITPGDLYFPSEPTCQRRLCLFPAGGKKRFCSSFFFFRRKTLALFPSWNRNAERFCKIFERTCQGIKAALSVRLLGSEKRVRTTDTLWSCDPPVIG